MSWDDAIIAHEIPGVALPHMPVIVVHRQDGSGTTSIFTNYLSASAQLGRPKPGMASQYIGRKGSALKEAMAFSTWLRGIRRNWISRTVLCEKR